MKQRIKEWYNFCGVDIRETDVLEAAPSIKLGENRYVCLPFRKKVTMIIELDGDWYYSTMDAIYSSEALMHYTVHRTEGGYQLVGTNNRFQVHPITDAVMDDTLNPLPPERRAEREAVLARLAEKPPMVLPRFGNIQWGDW